MTVVSLNFSLDGEGKEVVNFSADALSPIDLAEVFDPIINTGSSTIHTITIEGTQMHCSGGGVYTVDSIDLVLLEYR